MSKRFSLQTAIAKGSAKWCTSSLLALSLLILPTTLAAKAQDSSADSTSVTLYKYNQLLKQLEHYNQEENSLSQVNNVNQLRDVYPTDWAYEALRSLVERYGCIVGYPDNTFRGNRALSRYEFAAGLNACVQKMESLLAASEAVLRDDIAKLQRLMKEFEAELAALGTRVDNLEGRVAFLEDRQFSTTTKLIGEVLFGLTNSFDEDNINQAILGDRVRLQFNTSFTGQDLLVTRVAAGNFGRFKNDFQVNARIDGVSTGVNLKGLASGTNTQTFNVFPGNNNDVVIDWLGYYLPPIKLANFLEANAYVAVAGAVYADYVPTVNPYFEDFDGGNGALSTFASRNPIYRIGGGGAFGSNFDFDISNSIVKSVELSVGYLPARNADPSQGAGLFNGDYSLLAQLVFNLFERVDFGFTYVRGFHKADSPIFADGATAGIGLVGTRFANLSESALVNAFVEGGGVNRETAEAFFDIGDKNTNNFGAELAWRINEQINFNAFFTYTDVELTESNKVGEIWTYGGGFAFRDLLKEKSVLGIFAGVQPYLGGLDVGGVKVDTKNPIHVEVFFKYPLSDNISITPGFIYLSNAEQTDDSKDQVIGTIRTTFTF